MYGYWSTLLPMTDFDEAWRRIVEHAGQTFVTVRGIAFQYDVIGSTVVPRHTRYPLHRSQFEIAAARWPVAGPGELNRIVRGPAYIFAILGDARTGI